MNDAAAVHPGRRFNLSRWAIEHAAMTRYLLVVTLIMGALAYFQLGQNEDPPFTFRAMVLRAVWPGANAEQMAHLVADPLEQALEQVPGAGTISTYTKPGLAQITFELRDDMRGADVPQAFYNARKKIGDMRHSLPAGVLGPFFDDDFGDVWGVIYALHGPGFSAAELKRAAQHIRSELLRVDDVGKVELFGVQDEQIFVELDHARLSRTGLRPEHIAQQLAAQTNIHSAGEVRAGERLLPLRIAGQWPAAGGQEALEMLRQLPLSVPPSATAATMVAGGAASAAATAQTAPTPIRLGDVAHIWRGPAAATSLNAPAVVRHNGHDSVAIGVAMRAGGDIIALGRTLDALRPRIAAALPAGMELAVVQNQPHTVGQAVGEFVGVLMEAVLIVLAVSLISLGLHRKADAAQRPWWARYYIDWRPGLVVAVTIPLVLAGTFVAMWYFGLGLDKVSLGALIIALGLLVDDAIIAVEMMVLKLEQGWPKLRAATFAYEVTAAPMLTGTLITAAGFLPIGLARSTVGEYTFAIFAVTAIALVLSWLASVYFVPWLGMWLLKEHTQPSAQTAATAQTPDTSLPEKSLGCTPEAEQPHTAATALGRCVAWCVRHRWLTIGATLASFALGLAGMGLVQQQFFPASNRVEILVDAWWPEGTAPEHTAQQSLQVQQLLMAQSGVRQVTSWSGSGVPRFYLPLDQLMPQTNVAQFIVEPTDLAARDALMHSLPDLLRTQFGHLRTRAKLLSSGPPVAYPVQYRIKGPEPAQLKQLAAEVHALMHSHPDLHGVHDDWHESVAALTLPLDQDRARTLGLSSQGIAHATHSALTGVSIGQWHEGTERIDIVLRHSSAPASEQALASIQVPTAQGAWMALDAITQPSLSWESGVLWRHQRQWALTVQADTRAGVQGATITTALAPQIAALQDEWAARGLLGYHIEAAGAAAESDEGAASIVRGLPVMLLVVFTLLMVQLRSFGRAALVWLTGPLGLAGVAAALLILDRPFGFVALLGVIALLGMIQRNSVILIDQIELNRAAGMPPVQAIVAAAVRRARPVALTAATAVLAMIPLSRSVFWGPMAVAIMGGLIVATVLTLLALPAMYAAWFKVPTQDEPQRST